MLAVTHASGYAEVTYDTANGAALAVELKPWGRIEGVCKPGTGSAAHQRCVLSRIEQIGSSVEHPYVRYRYETFTNDEGHLAVERVAPGRYDASFLDNSNGLMQYARMLVNAGGTSRFTLGGPGRTATGRLVFEPGQEAIGNWRTARCSVLPTSLAQPRPARLYESTPEGRMAERHDLYTWESECIYQGYTVQVSPDGTFRATGIPSGNYTIAATVYGGDGNDLAPPGRLLATGQLEFEVKDEDEKASDPLYVGTVSLRPVKSAR